MTGLDNTVKGQHAFVCRHRRVWLPRYTSVDMLNIRILPLADIWVPTKTSILVLSDTPRVLESRQWFIMDVLIQSNLGISVFTPSSDRNDLNDTKMIIVRHFPSRNKDKVKKVLRKPFYKMTIMYWHCTFCISRPFWRRQLPRVT